MNRMRTLTTLSVALAATMTFAGCTTMNGYTGQTNDPNDPNRTQRGALIGAGIGAVAGLLSGDDATERRQRALVGAGVGALDVVRDGDNITLNMPGAITFGFDSSALQPQFRPVLDDLAVTLNEYNQTIVEVAGHTDSVGDAAYNQTLSEQRAATVANYLAGRGVIRDRMITIGAGETRPIASNDTEAGRAQNRRVEITLVPLQG